MPNHILDISSGIWYIDGRVIVNRDLMEQHIYQW